MERHRHAPPGTLGAFAGTIALIFAQEMFAIAAALALVGFALGFVSPANIAIISFATGRGAQGKVGGINMAARNLGVALGSIIGTWLYSQAANSPIIGAGVMIAFIGALSLLPAKA